MKTSKGEEKIIKILQKEKISFIREKTFCDFPIFYSWFSHGRTLPDNKSRRF